jgi:sirohydrochlorin ferrochelatase
MSLVNGGWHWSHTGSIDPVALVTPQRLTRHRQRLTRHDDTHTHGDDTTQLNVEGSQATARIVRDNRPTLRKKELDIEQEVWYSMY